VSIRVNTERLLLTEVNTKDVVSRTGLKKIHANFNNIYRKMENEYDQNPDDYRVRAGIVSLWIKMSMDALLLEKLFSKGIFLAILLIHA